MDTDYDTHALLDDALSNALSTMMGLAAPPRRSPNPPVAFENVETEGTCSVHLASLDVAITDQALYKTYAHLGALDAFVIQPEREDQKPLPPEKAPKVLPPAPAASVAPPIGLVVFRDAAAAYSAVDRMGDVGVKRWDVVLTPSKAVLKTPMGCMHRGCRTLLNMLFNATQHTQKDTLELLQTMEDSNHAAAILCCSKFLSPAFSSLISQVNHLRRPVTREILTTLFSEESSEVYVTDSMFLLADLHTYKYFHTEPLDTLDAIVSQDVKLTKRILKGLVAFVGRLQRYFDSVNTQGTLVKIRARSVDADGKENMIELCKLLGGNRPQAPLATPSRNSNANGKVTTVKAALVPADERTKEEAKNTSASRDSAAALISKQQCATCNSRAKFKCALCEKSYCAECHKYDEQVHECLARTVYVSKVDPALSDRELRIFLDSCGTVSKVRLCGDPSQRSVYGFIEFTAPPAAQKLIAHDRHMVGQNVMRCLPARQPIHDHSDDDYMPGVKPKQCQFGLTKHNAKRNASLTH